MTIRSGAARDAPRRLRTPPLGRRPMRPPLFFLMAASPPITLAALWEKVQCRSRPD
jgi:hypothetical protein